MATLLFSDVKSRSLAVISVISKGVVGSKKSVVASSNLSSSEGIQQLLLKYDCSYDLSGIHKAHVAQPQIDCGHSANVYSPRAKRSEEVYESSIPNELGSLAAYYS